MEQLWREMHVMEVVVRNDANPFDKNKQHQTDVDVVVHGDAQIYNNSPIRLYPGQLFIVVPPFPKLEQNIRGFPERAFYRIVQPLDVNAHVIRKNIAKYVHKGAKEKKEYFAIEYMHLEIV